MIKKIISLTFEGQIWKIVPKSNQLAFEIRNAEQRQTSFEVFDLEKYSFINQNIILNEPWWVGLQTISGNFLIVHYYDHLQYANHKGFSVIDIATKNVVWFNRKLIFEATFNDFIVAIDPKNQERKSLEIANGREISSANQTSEAKIEKSTWKYSELFESGSSNFVKVESFLNRKLDISAQQFVEYIEHDQKIIICYYTEGEKLDKWLIIFSNSGEILWHETIEKNLNGVSDSSLMVQEKLLLYTKNLNILEILSLG